MRRKSVDLQSLDDPVESIDISQTILKIEESQRDL